MLPKIVAIGAGNVASHIIPALEGSGAGEVVQVYSHTIQSASALASRLWRAEPVADTSDVIPNADIYVVSLADHAAPAVLAALKPNNALWVHTSGSLPVEALGSLSRSTGVFYPLQTFSKKVDVDLAKVPLFIEGSSPGVEARIREMGERIFENVYHADSALRKKMHVAAVFACNFANHLWAISDDLLRKEGLDISVLHPLLNETLRKAMTGGSPADGQTGPAVRGDLEVIRAHESMLDADLAHLYDVLSRSIINRHNPGLTLNNEQN